MSNSLRSHGLQHTRLPCPSPTPGVQPNRCPLSRRCHPTISSSVVPFSSCPQSFPASGSFAMSQLFTSGDQSIGASASASVLPVNIQGCLSTCLPCSSAWCSCLFLSLFKKPTCSSSPCSDSLSSGKPETCFNVPSSLIYWL